MEEVNSIKDELTTTGSEVVTELTSSAHEVSQTVTDSASHLQDSVDQIKTTIESPSPFSE